MTILATATKWLKYYNIFTIQRKKSQQPYDKKKTILNMPMSCWPGLKVATN